MSAAIPRKYPPLRDDPAPGAFTIAAADTDLAETARGLWADAGGTLVLTFEDGSGPFTFTVAAGTLLPFAVKRVAAASTATGIIGLR